MNILLFDLVAKWVSFLFVSLLAIISPVKVDKTEVSMLNENKNKDFIVENTVVDYSTIYEYSDKVPTNVSRLVTKGSEGLVYKDETGKIIKVIKMMQPEVIIKGTAMPGEYYGKMTGYGPDCAGCSKVGNVACFTREKTNHSLTRDGTIYKDNEYGEARILAADNSLFPCGTMIMVDDGKTEPYMGIVLDTGVAMRKAWQDRGEILIDLAFNTEKNPEIFKATNSNVHYSVQRWGW